MDKEVKELINSPKFLYSIAIILFVFFIVAGVSVYDATTYENPRDNINVKAYDYGEYNNYVGLIRLGWAPSAQSRQPQEKDIDTGIKLRDGDSLYSLMESRTWKTGDYGKSFVTRIN